MFHIPNFVDVPKSEGGGPSRYWRERLDLPQEAWVVVTVGRLHPVKASMCCWLHWPVPPGYIEGCRCTW